jgi:hypothetical protein
MNWTTGVKLRLLKGIVFHLVTNCEGFKLKLAVSITIVYYVVAQLVEALRYKHEGRGFDSRWSHWSFSVT